MNSKFFYTFVTAFSLLLLSTCTGAAPAPARISYPSEQETLKKHAQRFEWQATEIADSYVLTAATQPELLDFPWNADLFIGSTTGQSLVVTDLPVDGNPVYLRLWSKFGARWYRRDSVYASEFDESVANPRQECIERGWQQQEMEVGGVERLLLWRAPPSGNWQRGVILLLHGGGGQASDWCTDNLYTRHLFAFSQAALREGFAIVALESHGFEDRRGQHCGQRFDALGEFNDNDDLEYLHTVIESRLEEIRPPGASKAVFMAGISSGGFMTLRTATEMPELVDGFAAVAAGNPYSLALDCTNLTGQDTRPGFYLDTDTYLSTHNPDACDSGQTYGDQSVNVEPDAGLPSFMLLHHKKDGAVDISCMEKARAMLNSRGFKEDSVFRLEDDTVTRGWMPHFWHPEYNEALLDYFIRQSGG